MVAAVKEGATATGKAEEVMVAVVMEAARVVERAEEVRVVERAEAEMAQVAEAMAEMGVTRCNHTRSCTTDHL